MEKNIYCYKYPHPALTADCVVVKEENGEKYVLLVKRKNEPYKDCWAFPGGFMEIDETIESCAMRELKEETNLEAQELHLIGIYSTVDRDPRDRVVTAAYYVKVDRYNAIAGDDAGQVKWFKITNLPALAFDHRQIFADAKCKFF